MKQVKPTVAPEIIAQAEINIENAKSRIVLMYPWWASLMLRLDFKCVSNAEMGQPYIMGTDGRVVYFEPEWAASTPQADVQWVILHEVAHCVLMHCTRRGSREPMRWNLAADGCVNAILAEANLNPPASLATHLVPPAPLGMLAEELYDQLPPASECPMPDLDPNGNGEGSPEEKQQLEQEWQSYLLEARAAGLEPGGLERILDKVLAPRKNWREVIARFMASVKGGANRQWTRRSKRIQSVYMPGRLPEPQYKVAGILDTSGSMSQQDLSDCMAYASQVAEMNGVQFWLITADAEITGIYKPGDKLPTSVKGGGGTDFRPALEECARQRVDGAVYFTDGMGEYGERPKFPVVWVGHGVKAPYGNSICCCSICTTR